MLILSVASWLMFVTGTDTFKDTHFLGNSSDTHKDMYVIHAMVYQVGVLTNKTDNETANSNTTGNQEAFTFYYNNGSQIDLSQIPAPLLTNVTAQSLQGVAPVSNSQSNVPNHLPWITIKHLTNMAPSLNFDQGLIRTPTSIKTGQALDSNSKFEENTERSIDNIYSSLFKRDTFKDNGTLAISKGATLIPQTAGVQSIAIPPLLMLNNNLSHIPVPIPNTSVVQYAKINTLLTPP
ncbi:unnamed protein product [Arctia plantaginis]|uniref:Uncharacterized protein n=1 Tax=Arctia plantaginis TaxID=874455 RepID=A0A8S0Z0K7_ARCPL|nr:unnamed protein product [Arctia plantaginis]